jgi:hypothetical protein
MSRVSSQRCLAQQNRDVVQHIDHLDATGRRNEPRTTNLVKKKVENISYGPTRASMGISTYLLASADSVASGQVTNRTHSIEALSGW